jgi:hypothetical protein
LRNLASARKQGQLPVDTDADALAKFLTPLKMGLMSYGIVAPDATDRARIVGMLDRLLH